MRVSLTAVDFYIFPPQKLLQIAISPTKVRFSKSVKYKARSRINYIAVQNLRKVWHCNRKFILRYQWLGPHLKYSQGAFGYAGGMEQVNRIRGKCGKEVNGRPLSTRASRFPATLSRGALPLYRAPGAPI
jgi:hypothetical protein